MLVYFMMNYSFESIKKKVFKLVFGELDNCLILVQS